MTLSTKRHNKLKNINYHITDIRKQIKRVKKTIATLSQKKQMYEEMLMSAMYERIKIKTTKKVHRNVKS
jgi:hypothetical protein